MKTFIVLAVLIFSSVTWATPTCYVAQTRGPEVPHEICLENIQVNLSTGIISISDSSPILSGKIPTNYLARRNENGFSFRASDTYVNHWESGCKEGISVMINLRGKTDNDGFVEWLELSADYEHTVDTCHSQINKGTVYYKLKYL